MAHEVTDAEVEAAAEAIYESNPLGDQPTDLDGRPSGKAYVISWSDLANYDGSYRQFVLDQARAALTAALAARPAQEPTDARAKLMSLIELRHRCASSDFHDFDGCCCTEEQLRRRYEGVAVQPQEPWGWLCNGKGDGWEERDVITRDPETVAHREASPFWTVQPLYAAPLAQPGREELVEALRPFAQASQRFDDAATHFGHAPISDEYKPRTEFTHGDLRRARTAYRRLIGGPDD